MKEIRDEYTILIVAHRLSTIIDCDNIFVTDKGKIVASSTHKELLNKIIYILHLDKPSSI